VSAFLKAILWVLAFVAMLVLSHCQTDPARVQPIMAHYETQALCEQDFGGAHFCLPDNCSSIELVPGGNRVCSPRFYWSGAHEQFMMIKEDFSRSRLTSMSREGPTNASYVSEEGRSVLDE
jgi:hypothetical protein